jgi:SpoVK/Ycf46/Vps4 family AAA+-type ATPase
MKNIDEKVKGSQFIKKIDTSNSPLLLPDAIQENIIGIINAVGYNAGVNKFLFEGSAGTGKTESVKHIARILDRELYIVDFDLVIDSKLGKTSKNISALFSEISSISNPNKVVILLDEIDAIAIDRINTNDSREMGRATSSVMRGLDSLNDDIVLIATTNLYKAFDRALLRRFDAIINFDKYTKEELIEIGEYILDDMLQKFKFARSNKKLFRKILNCMDTILYPAELKNLIKKNTDLKVLKERGFSVREIEILARISKSQVSRKLKE